MRARYLVLPALALVLASCGSPEPEAAPEPTEAATSAVEATPESPEESTEEPATEPVDLTTACDPGEPETSLATAITATDLPDTAVVKMVQEVRPHREADQSEVDVVVYLCTTDLTGEEHRTVATDLAIAARDEGTEIGEFHVDQYIVGEDGLEPGPGLSVDDFGLYTWDRGAAVPPETNWES